MKISIVSLAWNKYDLTKGFLERLKAHTPIEHELVFTDNGSKEDISGLVKAIYPEAALIRYEENIGCPATRNPSMERVTGDIVFWLDNDTYVDKGWYEPFLEELVRSEKLGIVGVDGRRVARPFSAESPWVFPWATAPSPYVDWFVGFAVAFRRVAYKPIPDWGLAVNFDDVDLGVGIKANGYLAKQLPFSPNLKHLTSQTGPGWKIDREKELDLFRHWWTYWEPFKGNFEEYKV